MKDRIEIAKLNWQRKQAVLIHQTCKFPYQAWQASARLAKGYHSQNSKSITMEMRMKNGELATNAKQNIEVVVEHHNKVYNSSKEQSANTATFIKQREMYSELDEDITWSKFNKAVDKLKKGKATGITGMPPDAFKCLQMPSNASTGRI